MSIYNARIQNIDLQETRRYAGLKNSDFDDSLIQEACNLALLLIEPKCSWKIYDYDFVKGEILGDTSVILQGDSITNHLSECCQVAVFSSTVGIGIEEKSNKLFTQGKYTLGTLLDAAGTTAVEQTANQLETIIYNEVRKNGLSMKWRFSPGYGDWPIQQQPDILRISEAQKIGITLTDGMMLSPQKSITAVIGLYRNNIPSNIQSCNIHDCSSCNRNNCLARKSL